MEFKATFDSSHKAVQSLAEVLDRSMPELREESFVTRLGGAGVRVCVR